jgi:hypothetical protein
MDIVEQFREQQRIAERKSPPFIPDHKWLSWGDAADEIERLKGYIEELEGTVSISALANQQLNKENKRLMIYRKAIHKMCSHRMKTVDHYIMDAKQAVAWYEDLTDEALDEKLKVDDYIRIAKQAHLDAGD